MKNGLGSSKYKPAEYKRLQAIIDAKRLESDIIRQKVNFGWFGSLYHACAAIFGTHYNYKIKRVKNDQIHACYLEQYGNSTPLGYKMLLQKANRSYYPAQEELKLTHT